MADTVIMPKLGFDMAEGTLVRWVKPLGVGVSKGDVLAEIETDKATVEVESNFTGVMNQYLVEEGSVVPVNTPIAIIAAPGEQVDDAVAITHNAAPASSAAPQSAGGIHDLPVASGNKSSPGHNGSRIKASPLAKRVAEKSGISLDSILGTGPNGRIVRRDVEKVIQSISPTSPIKPPVISAGSVSAPVRLPEPAAGEFIPSTDKVIPLTRLRSVIARRMVEAKQVPHFYLTHEYDMGPMMKLRKEINEMLSEEERLSVNDFIVRAVALTLRAFPNLNASFVSDGILPHSSVNIGVAVALDGGLMTVVIRNADQKPLRQISSEVKSLAEKARTGKMKPEDIEGSTFSISNLGMYDVQDFTAIINPPEAAILAVSSVRQTPVVVDGNLTVGTRMNATLSADHRITDGAEAALFMKKLADYLEKPARLLI